jgi:hypothetical protein
MKSHDRVCAQLHLKIYKGTSVQFHKEHWYKHVPELVETSPEGTITILGNRQVQTENRTSSSVIMKTEQVC